MSGMISLVFAEKASSSFLAKSREEKKREGEEGQ